MSDRYKPMGLELLPSKHYHVKRPDVATGTAWVYQDGGKVAVIKFDGAKILTATSKNLMDIGGAARGDLMQDFLIDCAERDVPIEEAKSQFLEHFGQPDIVVEAADVNDVAPEVRAALAADTSMK